MTLTEFLLGTAEATDEEITMGLSSTSGAAINFPALTLVAPADRATPRVFTLSGVMKNWVA